MKTITELTFDEQAPVQSAKEIELIYSDSGKIVLKLQAPLFYRYLNESPRIEFPDGFKITFYDRQMNISAELTAKYGVSWEDSKIMEAKNNVVIHHYEKNETLNTEHLVWDQRRKKIYSDVFIKRTTPDGVLYGDGFDADEDLTSYTLRNPRGIFEVTEIP